MVRSINFSIQKHVATLSMERHAEEEEEEISKTQFHPKDKEQQKIISSAVQPKMKDNTMFLALPGFAEKHRGNTHDIIEKQKKKLLSNAFHKNNFESLCEVLACI